MLVFNERALVSREIHDTLLQSLAAIGVELETVLRQLDPRQTAVVSTLHRLQRQTGALAQGSAGFGRRVEADPTLEGPRPD